MTFSTVLRSTVREWPESMSSAAWATPRRRSSIVSSGITSLLGRSSGVGWLISSSFWSSSILNIQILHKLGVGLNEALAQLHFCSHQLVEDSVSLLGVFDPNLDQNALIGDHG